VELWVVCPVCGQQPANLSSTPYRQLENQAPNTTGSNSRAPDDGHNGA